VRRLGLHGHVGQCDLDGLEVDDPLLELLPLRRVPAGEIALSSGQAGRRPPGRSEGGSDVAAIQFLLRVL
jgi:hypothetical protein